MPTVRYDFSHSFGGTPAEQSKKFFRRINANSGFILSQIHYNQAHWLESLTPCLQNRLEVIATLSGQSDFYDVLVSVAGTVYDFGGSSGIPQVTGGLHWHYDDSAARIQANSRVDARNIPAVPRITPVAYQFAMRIPDNTPTLVAITATAAAMTITNPTNNGSIGLQNFSLISVNINMIQAWKRVRINRIPFELPGGDVPGIPTPSATPGTDTSKDSEDYGYHYRPVDGDLAVLVESRPEDGATILASLPEDEQEVNDLMASLRIDLTELRQGDLSGRRPQIFWRT